MYKSILTILLGTIILAGCVTQPQQDLVWKTLSGSKADGTLTLAYEKGDVFFSFYQQPNPAQGQSLADARCKVWGFKRAVPFDFTNEQCKSQSTISGYSRMRNRDTWDSDNDGLVYNNNDICDTILITQKYQCEQ